MFVPVRIVDDRDEEADLFPFDFELLRHQAKLDGSALRKAHFSLLKNQALRLDRLAAAERCCVVSAGHA